MEYILKDGSVLTEEMIEELAEAAERGNLPGTPGEYIIAPPGRPRLSDEELVTVAFKIPRSQCDALDEKAKEKNQSRSQFMRTALAQALML